MLLSCVSVTCSLGKLAHRIKVELGLTLQVQAPVGQEFHSGKSRVAPTLMTQTPQILTLPTAEHGSGPSMSTVGCVCVWRALSPLILLCGMGQSSLARKDPAFVPPGPPHWLGSGLWALGILSAW